jgi:amino acid transporter
MYLLCCAACWFLVQRDVRSDGQPFNFPGMKIVPALAIIAIIWILGQSAISESPTGSDTRAGLRMAAWVLVGASIFYILWRSFTRSQRANM